MNSATSVRGTRSKAKAARRTHTLPLHVELLEDRRLPSALGSYGQLPLAFEPNQGQTSSRVDFVAHGQGYALALTASDALLSLAQSTPPGTPSAAAAPANSTVLDLHLVGANSQAFAAPQDHLQGVSNYLRGNDPAQWRTNIPTYGRVVYQDVYPGVDLAYYGNQGQLEYDWIVRPNASAAGIGFQVQGASALTLDATGALIIRTPSGDVIDKAPLAYQEKGAGRQSVAARYVLQDGGTVGLALGAHDASLPVVVDPVLLYSTYLGGSLDDGGAGVAVDSSGNAYITGGALSDDFPTANPLQGPGAGLPDAYIAKLNPSGTGFVYSTYLGGSAGDGADAIAVDSSGNVYITGDTESNDFPTLNPVQATRGPGRDAFVTKLNPAGNALVYSTYLGGSNLQTGTSIAVDPAGNANITGFTNSTNFPTAVALQPTGDGATHAFVTRLTPAGNAFVFSTYLGTGPSGDFAYGIAADAAGNAFITGTTSNTHFPTLNALQPTYGGGPSDAFVAKIRPKFDVISGTTSYILAYSTYLGGSADDEAEGIALDASGSPVIAGATRSTNFPTAVPRQSHNAGGFDAFLTKLTPAGTGLVYSTYLGGSADDVGKGVALDAGGNVYMVGKTSSGNFPTHAAVQPAYGGGTEDAFVAKLNAPGTTLIYSTYLGGTGDEFARGVAVDAAANAYVTGDTASTDFPTVNPLQPASGGSFDAFIAKIASHFWQVQDLAVAADGHTRVLWSALDGSSVVWSVDNTFHAATGPIFPPFANWSVQDGAVGSDGLTRLLWTNTDGRAALWRQAADGMYAGGAIYGPFAGWTARDVAVASDGTTRILWTHTSGQAVVWSLDANFNVTPGPVYGPFAGWSATRLAAGSDGLLRLLWNNTSGAAALWVLDAAGNVQSTAGFGPVAGWTAQDVTVGSDHRARLLWATSNGQMVVWSLDASFTITSGPTYGPFPGYKAVRLDAGPDGLTRILWNEIGGIQALWLLNASGTLTTTGTFGPL